MGRYSVSGFSLVGEPVTSGQSKWYCRRSSKVLVRVLKPSVLKSIVWPHLHTILHGFSGPPSPSLPKKTTCGQKRRT